MNGQINMCCSVFRLELYMQTQGISKHDISVVRIHNNVSLNYCVQINEQATIKTKVSKFYIFFMCESVNLFF